jgi:hypothetical protein
MQESGTIILHPFTKEDEEIISAFESCNRFNEYWEQRPHRGVYILGDDQKNIIEGETPFIADNPALQRYYIDGDGVQYIDLDNLTSSNRDSAKKTRKPRLLFKVLRGSRVVVYIDETGRFTSTGDIVNAPVDTTDSEHTLTSLYAILNCPVASYYVHRLVYNESTETARNLDAPYIGGIPIPSINHEKSETLTNVVNYTLFLNQFCSDSDAESEDSEIAEFFVRLSDALTASLYLDLPHTGIEQVWEELSDTIHSIEYSQWADKRFSTDSYPDEETDSIYQEVISTYSDMEVEKIEEVIANIENDAMLQRVSEVLNR